MPEFHRRAVTVLTALLLLFCLRVLAQLLQAWSPVVWLPPFEAWASGALPYWVLVVFQVLIVVVCARVIRRLYVGLEILSMVV